MAVNQITGRVYQVGMTQTITGKSGNQITKRELILDITTQGQDGRIFENYAVLEFSGNNCSKCDNLQQGQEVTVSYDIRGSKYTNQQGETKFFTRLGAFRVDFGQPQQYNNGYNQPQYNNGYNQPQQGGYQPQQAYNQPQQAYNQPQQAYQPQPQQGGYQPQPQQAYQPQGAPQYAPQGAPQDGNAPF